MPDMPDLGKKVGPLPIGAWVVVVAGGLAVGYYINNKQKKSAPAEQQLTESGVGTGGGTFLPINPPSTTPDETVPETNQSWGNKAITWLIAQNINANTANSAVTKFLSGQTLDAVESAAIAMVLGRFGPPPEGTSSPPDNPAPSAPTNLVATLNVSGRIAIAWSPVVGAIKYEVTYNDLYGSQWGPVTAIVPAYGSPVGGNNTYTYYVRAINDYGQSEPASLRVVNPAPGGAPAGQPPVVKPPVNTPPAAPPPQQKTYVIRSGDTLSGIAQANYGTGSRWLQIYNANAGAIEAAARSHGHSSSRGPNGTMGWWIFPGTQIIIP